MARKGIDLYSFDNCRAKNLWDAPLKYAYPDGTSPGINDTHRSPVAGGWQATSYDYAYLRYQDPNYGGIVNNSPTQIYQSEGHYFPSLVYDRQPDAKLEGLGSVIFDSLGYAIMRGHDGGDQTFLLMKYGPHGGTHGHPDKLNLVLYADGDELGGEPGMYRYEDKLHSEWSRPSIAHWTVSVDQKSQLPSAGRMIIWEDADDIKIMRGQSDASIPGVGMDRTAIQMPGYFIDIFHVWSKSNRTFDLPLCFRGSLDAVSGIKNASETLKPMSPSARGYKHILARETVSDDNWTGIWTREAVTAEQAATAGGSVHPANKVSATVIGQSGSSFFVGVDADERHRVVVRRKGVKTTFATVIDPYKASDAVKSAEAFKVECPVGAYGIRIGRTDGGTDLVIVRFDPQMADKPAAAATFEGGSTDALTTIIRLDKDGKVIRMGMIGGTSVRYGTAELNATKPGIGWMR